MSESLRSRAYVYLAALCVAAGLASLGAPSVAAAEECPNAAFRTGPASRLPDCRAYEMVSPPFKNAGRLQRFDSSPDGSSALTGAFSAFAGLESFSGFPFAVYSTRRTASGWVTAADELPGSEYLPFTHNGFSPDWTGASLGGQATVWLDRGVWQADNRVDFFMRRPDRSIVDVGPGLPPSTPAGSPFELGESVDLYAAGVSADASRLLFEIKGHFWPSDGTEEGLHTLYEYLGTGNTTPLLVGVDNSGKQISQCGIVLGSGTPTGYSDNGLFFSTHNAVSTDGNTVFFTAYPDNYIGEETGDGCKGSAPPVAELFARIDNGLADARTVAISEPSNEDCSACDTEAGVLANAKFEGASEDGSRVFFTTTQPLLGSDTSRNIYEYDSGAPAGSRIVRVSAGDSTVSAPAAGVLPTTKFGFGIEPRVPQISEDGSHVYFLANGVLTRTPNGQGEAAEAGAANLYVFERDARYPAGRIAFVARLSAEDVRLWAPSLVPSGVNVTPDGRFLVFTSNRDLTPDDTSGAQQVFEYDAQTGVLVRVSVGQDGFNHNGNVPVRTDALGFVVDNARIMSPSYEVPYNASEYWSHLSVSADGSYVFFQSPVGLTPQAIDQKVIGYNDNGEGRPVYANNVYEYHAGRVSLISDGQDITATAGNSGLESNVRLEGTNASGSDVFFNTQDRLVAQDSDSNVDMYDARIDGGFPPPAPPPSCSGDACQGQLSGAPVLLSPGSEFQAGGNPPLAGRPAVKSKKPKKKRKPGTGRHAKRRERKAKRAAAGGRAHWKAGRS
jgi:hypothetical protein